MSGVSLLEARTRLAAERERLRRAAEPRVRPPAGTIWRPTPTRLENDYVAANPGSIVMQKTWDLSPIEPWSFDPTQPPSSRPDPPANTVLPLITPLTDLTVGAQLVCTVGTWVNDGAGPIIYARAWLRDGLVLSATGVAYTLAADDVGSMIGCTVTALNNGGATTANALPVGPIVPAAP